MVKFKGSASRMRVGALVAAVAVAGLLGACEDSRLGTKSALKQAEDAGRLARSAGELRPKANLLDDLGGKTLAESKAYAESTAKSLGTDPAAGQKYFDQKTRAEDLKDAVAQLNSAAAAAKDLPPMIRASIYGQQGTVTGQYAAELLREAQDKVLELSRKAVALQDQASYVMALAGQANVQGARSKVQEASTAAAQADVASAKEATQKAQGVVDDLTKQINDRKSRASDIYAQAEQGFQAADQMKGNAAVEAGRKVMESRKEGDKLSAEAATLGLQLTEAQAGLVMAQIKEKEADSKLSILQSGIVATQKQATGATKLATTLHDLATDLVEAKTGLAEQQKSFNDLWGQIDKELTEAAGQTAAADTAGGAAVAAVGDAQSKLAGMTLDPNGALSDASHDARAKSLAQLQQAAAKTQTGEVKLLQAEAAMLKTSADTAISMAQDAVAGKPRTTPPGSAPSALADTYKSDASKHFKAASALAATATNAAKASPPVQWLGLTLQAAATYGQGIADGDKAVQDSASNLARSAMELNPYLSIQGLLGEGQSTGNAGPAEPSATSGTPGTPAAPGEAGAAPAAPASATTPPPPPPPQ